MPVYIALIVTALVGLIADQRHRRAEDMRAYALLRLGRQSR